jgi:transposase
MAFREVTMLEVIEVVRMWLSQRSKKEIARQLGVDVKTVRRYVKVAAECGLGQLQGPSALTEELTSSLMEKLAPGGGRSRGAGWSLCEKHRDFIRSRLKQRLRLTKIRKLLRRREVFVSYPTLHRFAVQELGFSSHAPTLPVVDGEAGQELQFDTGWVGSLGPDLVGRKRRFRAFIFTAVRSRHRFVYPVFQETTEQAIEACEAAWEFFSGIFRVLIVDNAKAIVDKADPLGARLNRTFREYAQARGFFVDTTRVRAPRDKARVERSVQTVRDDCFAGERLYDLEQARARARRWCLEDYGMHRHSTTQRLPLEHFEAEERPVLLAAPTRPYEIPLWCDPKVGRDQFAQVQKALYSLPFDFRRKQLKARADRSTVRFYDGNLLVKTHPRVAPGQRSTDRSDFPEHKAAYAFRDLDFLIRNATAHGTDIGEFARRLLQTELPWTRMRQVYALLGVVQRFGQDRVNQACRVALEADLLDVRKLRRLLELAVIAPSDSPSSTRLVPLARYLRPPQQYALPLATKPLSQKGDSQ